MFVLSASRLSICNLGSKFCRKSDVLSSKFPVFFEKAVAPAQLGMEVKENHVPPENPASSVKKLCAMFERE